MKFAILLAFLSLSSIFNTVYATEEDASVSENVAAFCDEQAQLAGIEDADEKNIYVKECMESYGVLPGDSQQQD